MTSVAFGNRCDTCFVCRRNSKSTSAHVILTNLTTWETVETEMVTPKTGFAFTNSNKETQMQISGAVTNVTRIATLHVLVKEVITVLRLCI